MSIELIDSKYNLCYSILDEKDVHIYNLYPLDRFYDNTLRTISKEEFYRKYIRIYLKLISKNLSLYTIQVFENILTHHNVIFVRPEWRYI